MKTINLNDSVKFQLTHYGYTIWADANRSYSIPGLETDVDQLKRRADSEGFICMQAWEAMNLFGEHLQAGFKTVFERSEWQIDIQSQ